MLQSLYIHASPSEREREGIFLRPGMTSHVPRTEYRVHIPIPIPIPQSAVCIQRPEYMPSKYVIDDDYDYVVFCRALTEYKPHNPPNAISKLRLRMAWYGVRTMRL